MRALFFADVPHRMGGAQRSLLAALERIGAHGVEPLVVFPHEGKFVDACLAARLDARVLPAPAAFRSYGGALLRAGRLGQLRTLALEGVPYSAALARLARTERVSVFHFNTARGLLLAGAAPRLAGLRCALHQRGMPRIGGVEWLAAQALAHRVVLVAHALKPHLHPLAAHKARVVHNGVHAPALPTRAEARSALAARLSTELSAHQPVFVTLSSLVPFKGLHHLVSGAARARARGLDAHYVVAGEGLADGYEAWLRSEVSRQGLGSRVHFVGYVADPWPLLAASDALVLPSVESEWLDTGSGPVQVRGNEGLPRSILEAMAASRAVIASHIVGVGEQVTPGETGVLVPPGDPEALASALVHVGGDPSRRERYGEAGGHAARARFSLESAAAGLAAVLRELAPAPSRGG